MRRKIFFGLIISFLLVSLFSVGQASWLITDVDFAYSSKFSEEDDRAVAYIDKTGERFISVKSALEAASKISNLRPVVYVYTGEIGTTDNGGLKVSKRFEVEETGNLLVSNGVTLCIPYSGEEYKPSDPNNEFDGRNNNGSGFADQSETDVLKNLSTNLILSDNSSLTIEEGGTLLIGGQIGVSAGAGTPQGCTSGLYSQITLKNGASIVCLGKIDCRGYIKPVDEAANDSTSVVVGSSNGIPASINLPAVFYDFEGGTIMCSIYTNGNVLKLLGATVGQVVKGVMFPLNVFDFPNISVPLTIFGGGTMKAYAGLYFTTASKNVLCDVNIVGEEGSALFGLETGSSLVFDYVPSVEGLSSNDLKSLTSNKNLDYRNYEKVTLKGNASFSNISVLAQPLENLSVVLTTEDIFVPISYKFDITIESGSCYFPIKTKWLPGSKLTVNSGASAVFQGDTVFYPEHLSSYLGNASWAYPPGSSSQKLFDKAILENNGSVSFSDGVAFGGFITPGNGSTLTFGNGQRSCESLDPYGNPGTFSCDTSTTFIDASSDIYVIGNNIDRNASFGGPIYSDKNEFYGDGYAYDFERVIYDVSIIENAISGNNMSYTVSAEGAEISETTNGYDVTAQEGTTIKLSNLENVAYALYNGQPYIVSNNELTIPITGAGVVEVFEIGDVALKKINVSMNGSGSTVINNFSSLSYKLDYQALLGNSGTIVEDQITSSSSWGFWRVNYSNNLDVSNDKIVPGSIITLSHDSDVVNVGISGDLLEIARDESGKTTSYLVTKIEAGEAQITFTRK